MIIRKQTLCLQILMSELLEIPLLLRAKTISQLHPLAFVKLLPQLSCVDQKTTPISS